MFAKILIADRGASALRIARTCERIGVATVSMHGDHDREAAHAQIGNAAVHVPGADPYGDVAAVIEAAKQTGAEAVHPGMGPLAMSAAFARALGDAGIKHVGLPAELLTVAVDRLAARELARQAGVRVAAGAEVAVRDRAAAHAIASRLGTPLRVTPARRSQVSAASLDDLDELDRALEATSEAAERASGDGRVYLERELYKPRHLQVQLVAAEPENAVVLGEREQSVRLDRTPLVVEEPAPALGAIAGRDPARHAIAGAARAIAAEAALRGVVTLDFLLDADGQLCFLGLDPRLGPEHALGELRSGVDLVEEQLRIAAGEELSEQVWTAEPVGHAIQARICIDDPTLLAPSGPALETLRWPTLPPDSLRVESAWLPGAAGPEPLVAAVTTYQQSRHAALLVLDRVLAEVAISPVATNLAFLRVLLGEEALRAGQYDVTFAPRVRIEAPAPAAAQPPQASSVEPA